MAHSSGFRSGTVTGQSAVQHDQVVRPARGGGERRRTVTRGGDLETGTLQIARDDVKDRRVVIHDEDPGGIAHLFTLRRPLAQLPCRWQR